MKQYHDLLKTVLENGNTKSDRTGTGTISIFGYQMRFNLSDGFPLLTTKKIHFKSVVYELLWFLKGSTNISYLKKNNIRIWDEWADANGNLGPVYGHQWRKWPTSDGKHIDQIANLIKNLKNNPYSRRHIINAWNVGAIDEMALPPCHLLFQFYVTNDQKLNCKLFQRSADLFLGVPFNIASYSLLVYMIAAQCDLKPGEFVWSGTDCHIYENHLHAVEEQLTRNPYQPPTLSLNHAASIDHYTYEHVQLHNYQHHPTIKATVAI